MTYQGHHSDGSSVQKHSVGDIYPYVIQIREIANSSGGWNRVYELLHTDGRVTSHLSHEQAWETASAAIVENRRKAASTEFAQAVAPFAPLIRSGVTTLAEITSLIISINGAKHGLPVDRKDQVRYSVLLGFATLAKASGQRSAREDLIVA